MQFTYYWPTWAIILAIIISICITIYGYTKVGQPIPQFLRFSLITLRFIAIIILLCCLLAPVIFQKKDITPPTHLSILVDTSRSMQLEDNYLGKTDSSRMNQVNQLLFDESSQFLQKVNSEHKVHLYHFDNSLHESIIGVANFEPDGSLTDIAAAIKETVQAWRGQPNAGIILISDGAHNTSNLSIDNIAAMNTPVYAIGVGSLQPPKDIQIQKVDVLPIAYTGHETQIRITVGQTGYADESIRLSLRDTGTNRLVDAAMVTFPENNNEQSITSDEQRLPKGSQHVIELKLTPQTEGNFQYKVVLPTLAGELTDKNNEKTFTIKVVKAKLNVLYFEGRPRWEYAFLKRTLERDPDIDPTFAIQSKKSVNDSVLSRYNGFFPQDSDTTPTRFPETREELYQYDVLILGDITDEHLTMAQQQAVVDFVEQRGKAVIFLPSHNALGVNGFRKTEISRILPIQIPANGCMEQKGEYALNLTQNGMFHPIMQLTDKIERNNEIWQNLPALSHSYRGFQLRAGATTLINKDNGEPILIFHRVGLGKSLFFAAEGLWNWDFGVNSYKDKVYQTVYSRFWAQTLRWMAQQSDENQIYISTDASTYSQGETAKINIRTFSLTLDPQINTEIQLSVTTPSGIQFPLKTHTETSGTQMRNAGNYTTQLKVEEKGTYNIRAVGKAGNIPLGEDEIDIFVHPQLIELEAPQLNEPLLKELATKTGGVYSIIDDAHSLPDKINIEQDPIFVDTQRDLWAHPIVLIAIVGLLGTEWFIRKRIGLI